MHNRKITLASRGAAVALAAIAALLLGSMPGLADGDAAAGKQAFTTTCGACHSTEPGINKIGPSLAGIVGSKSGAVAGYNFSPALKAANITWTSRRWINSWRTPLPMFTEQKWLSAFQTPSIGATSLRISRR